MRARVADERADPCAVCKAVRYEDCVCHSPEAHEEGCPALVHASRETSRGSVPVAYGLGPEACRCGRPPRYRGELLRAAAERRSA